MPHVGILDEPLMHPFPYPFQAPADESLVDAVPLTLLGRQQPPLGAATGDPQHPFDEAAAIGFLADVHIGTAAQEFTDLGPLAGSQFDR